MSNLSIFENAEFGQVRCMMIDDEPWFVGKDIATALGFENPTKAVRDHVDNDDKKMGVQNVTPSITDSLGRTQYPTWINESGIYSLVFSSRLESAKRFKRWVTSEVLPSVRKHGAYIKDQEELSPEEIMARGLRAAESIIAEKQKKIEAQAKVIEENKPKVDYYNAVLDSTGLLNITQIAKEFGMTAEHMNKLLGNLGIQYKAGKCWVPRQKYADKGYMKSCTRIIAGRTVVQYRWTQKGREFIHRVMARYGFSPVSTGEAVSA